jgi:diguanylate cyclase (GGDEF)-like protein/PAS domain S-box-containing protein
MVVMPNLAQLMRLQHAGALAAERWRASVHAAIAVLLVGAVICLPYLEVRLGWALPLSVINGLVAAILAAAVYRWHMNSSRALRAAERHQERLAAVVEGTGVGIWDADLAGGVVYLSDSWLRLAGRDVAAGHGLSAEDWMDIIHPDDRERVLAFMRAGMLTGDSVFQVDHRIRHADGRWIWVASMSRIIQCNAAGEPSALVGTHVDITARKAAEVALAQSEAKFRSLFERSPVGIALSDYSTQRFLQVNEALRQPSGYSAEELLQLSYGQLVQRSDHGPLDQPIGLREREIRRKDGTSYSVLISGIRMTDDLGRDVVWTIVQDISQRKAAEQQLAAAAMRDRLTGLANRAFFMEQLQLAVNRVRDGTQQLFAVLFLDFDRFKVINDAMGHHAGDQLLVQIAGRLRKSLRGSDAGRGLDSRNLVARFGGDEFLVLVNDLERPEDAAGIANRLSQALSHAYSIQGRDVHSSASIGIVTSDTCKDGPDAIVRNADVAMYEAKRAGRACAVTFSESMHTRLSRHLLLETGLRKAIGTNELSLVYQPIIELGTGRRTSVEALVRWHHPVLGQVSPVEFVPMAEESDLIVLMGRWVMREACAALARWQQLDPDGAPRMVSVNVSRAELALGDRLLETIREALAAAGLSPQSLQLEVTEREVARDPKGSLALMHQLREMGVRLAMDDFGTGTSSLGYLREYPFDVIKIDRSFVNDLSAGPDTLAVIHATITLVENLGKCSVAEGIETPEQLAILQSLGCQYAQGYLLGRPMPEAEIVKSKPRVRGLASTPAAADPRSLPPETALPRRR